LLLEIQLSYDNCCDKYKQFNQHVAIFVEHHVTEKCDKLCFSPTFAAMNGLEMEM